MKRNNIFMWAYISFIFVAVFIRLFIDFSLWTPLVVAITLSSILFAIEDLYASLAKTLSDTCDIKEDFSPVAQERVEKAFSFYEKALSFCENEKLLNSTDYDIPSMRKICEHSKNELTEIKEAISEIEHRSIHDRKTQMRYQKAADISAYLGFLCLFCTLIITSLITIPIVIQEILTVCSFSLILITRQINIKASKKIKDDMIKYQKILHDQEVVEKNMSDTEKYFDPVLQYVENLADRSEEESNHAD